MRSAYWASTHPCWAGGVYVCDCGHVSPTPKAHLAHVRAVHNLDREYCARVLPWADYQRMFGEEVS